MPRQGSQNGPDWTDIRSLIAAIDSLHGSTTWLDLAPVGVLAGAEWQLTVTTVWPVVKGSGRALRLATQYRWPSLTEATIEGAIFKLLYSHDGRIGKEVYQQEGF